MIKPRKLVKDFVSPFYHWHLAAATGHCTLEKCGEAGHVLIPFHASRLRSVEVYECCVDKGRERGRGRVCQVAVLHCRSVRGSYCGTALEENTAQDPILLYKQENNERLINLEVYASKICDC